MNPSDPSSVLYVVACAAPPLRHVRDLISSAQGRGWDVCLIATPTAAQWMGDQLADLAAMTGRPVRSQYKMPGDPDVFPPAHAILAAPVTSNSINKWSAGISDTLALGIITEAIGKRLPITAVPSLNFEQEMHPAYRESIARLRTAGVNVLLDDEGHALRESKTEGNVTYPWHLALATLESTRQARMR